MLFSLYFLFVNSTSVMPSSCNTWIFPAFSYCLFDAYFIFFLEILLMPFVKQLTFSSFGTAKAYFLECPIRFSLLDILKSYRSLFDISICFSSNNQKNKLLNL
jgi:hypothetical protein